MKSLIDHPPRFPSIFVVPIFLVALLAAPSSLSAQAFEAACLVYASKTTSKSTGYKTYSYMSSGLSVVGPEFREQVEGYGGDGAPSTVQVKKRKLREYYFYTDSSDKKKYFGTSLSQDQDRIVGTVNVAKAGSSKPSVLVTFTFGGSTSVSFSNLDPVGKASWKSPYPGVSPGWLATAFSSANKFYDVNPDRDFANPQAPYNYVGQAESEYLPCAIYSGNTVYVFDSKRSESVKGKNFEDACAAVEASLVAAGYQRAP